MEILFGLTKTMSKTPQSLMEHYLKNWRWLHINKLFWVGII